jgi:hypothetical protein
MLKVPVLRFTVVESNELYLDFEIQPELRQRADGTHRSDEPATKRICER